MAATAISAPSSAAISAWESLVLRACVSLLNLAQVDVLQRVEWLEHADFRRIQLFDGG